MQRASNDFAFSFGDRTSKRSGEIDVRLFFGAFFRKALKAT
jgi:hypothetical protein